MSTERNTERGREALIERINAFEYWHYPFRLSNGVDITPTHGWADAANQMRDFIWPVIAGFCGGDMKGLRILDVGCNAGFWSLEAHKSGASFVLGIDASDVAIAQAELVRNALAISTDAWQLRQLDIYDISRESVGEFDVCLVFRVLHHLAHPLWALERLREVCRGRLVLDVSLHQQSEPVLALRAYDSREPFGGVSNGLALRPSRSAIEPLLNSCGFKDVTFIPPKEPLTNPQYFRGERAFVVATSG